MKTNKYEYDEKITCFYLFSVLNNLSLLLNVLTSLLLFYYPIVLYMNHKIPLLC